MPTIEEPSATVRSLRNRMSRYLHAQSVLLIAFAVMADPVSSVAYPVEAALRALQPTRDNRLWLLARRVAARGGGGRRRCALTVAVLQLGCGVWAAGRSRRLSANDGDGVPVWWGGGRVHSVIAGTPIGFAWPLTSHSLPGIQRMPGVAAAGAVEEPLEDRWPPG